jgi:biopolymer transport protein ExbD
MARRQRKDRRERDESEINITPMLDVVFIMLIFFIVTTSFVKETGTTVSRPVAETAQLKERGNILVGVRENGEVWINRQNVNITAVRQSIERLLRENPEGQVVIVADEDSDSEVVIRVMDQLGQAGVGRVSLASEQPE